MAELLKVKSRIKSIRDLRQITGAIELVAKIKISTVRGQFQKRNKYREVVESLFSSVQNFSSVPEIEAQAPHIVCVFFSQKGFCGAFNNRLVKKVVAEVATLKGQTEVWCFGRKSKKWAYAFKFPYKHLHLEEKNYVAEIAPLLEQWHQDWLAGKVRSLSFIHNQFRSILEQRANVIQLFPFVKPKNDSVTNEQIFETKPEELFTDMLRANA